MGFLIAFAFAFGLVVVYLVLQARRAGPRQLPEEALAIARPVVRIDRDSAGEAWSQLGDKTTARGLDLRFDHDDDPRAEATLLAPGVEPGRGNRLSHRLTVRLTDSFVTHHVHTRGYVFRASLRGTGAVIGKQVLLLMLVSSDGSPYGGRIENDDDIDAAVGDWIEVESAEILQIPER